MRDKSCHICVISEPNKLRAKNTPNSYCDINCDTCIILDARSKLPVIKYSPNESYLFIDFNVFCVVSVYFSPNVHIHEFMLLLSQLENLIRQRKNLRTIICGDFNAKNPIWGGEQKCDRGEKLAEFCAALDLIVLNTDEHPTFRRGESTSFIDVTLVTADLAGNVSSWLVDVEDENLSDHQNIYFEVETELVGVAEEWPRLREGWRFAVQRIPLFVERFFDSWEEISSLGGMEESLCDIVHSLMRNCADAVFSGIGANTSIQKEVYWWSEDIARLRETSIKLRRRYYREKNEAEKRAKKTLYLDAKWTLSKAIEKSKKKCWSKLLEDLNRDIWGKAYQIVRRRVGMGNGTGLTGEQLEMVVRELFPSGSLQMEEPRVRIYEACEPFTVEEIVKAAKRLKTRKAPGPDGFSSEVVKALIFKAPLVFKRLADCVLDSGVFPKSWKVARLVLIEKPRKDPNESTKYRPISILNTLAKWMELLLEERLLECVSRGGGLSERQSGFTRGKSTLHSLQWVKDIVRDVNRITVRRRDLCLLITYDVKNAFNTAEWSLIINRIQEYTGNTSLLAVLRSYFSDRYILVEGRMVGVDRGVPQGSVLGPICWNIFYDGILNLPTLDGVTLLGHADDLAAVVRARTPEALRAIADDTSEKVVRWMEDNHLSLAGNKTEAVLLCRRRQLRDLQFMVGPSTVTTTESLTYLGVTFDSDMKMTQHVNYVTAKAEKTVAAISRILPNIGGPEADKRSILAGVVNSALLYAVPIWGHVLKYDKYRAKLKSVQRKALLRVCAAYRTVSLSALQVLAGALPIDILVEERIRIYEEGSERKREIREEMTRKWQNRWSNETSEAEWTRTLVRDVAGWTSRKHGNLGHYEIQCFTGHGIFGSYRKRIGKTDTDSCWFCHKADDPHHTLFVCPRFDEWRIECEICAGEPLSQRNVAEIMLQSEEKWKIISKYMVRVMKEKEKKERLEERS